MYEVEYHQRISAIRDRLANYRPGSVVARAIEHLHISQVRNVLGLGMPWTVLFLLKIAMQGSPDGKREMSTDEFVKIASAIYRIQHLACPLDDGDIQLKMRPMVLQQAWYQGSSIDDVKVLTRQMLWYAKPGSIYTQKFEEAYGFTLEQFYLLSIYMIIGMVSEEKRVVEINLFDMIAKIGPSISVAVIVKYLALLSLRVYELRDFFIAHEVPGTLYQQSEYFQTTPLRKKPVLINDDQLLILNPRLFSRSISVLIPDLLKQIRPWGPQAGGFKDYFGPEMEGHIAELLTYSKVEFFSEDALNQICRQDSVVGGRMSDFLIPGAINVVLESKAIEPGDIVSSVFDAKILQSHLKGNFIKGIEQCQESFYRLRKTEKFKDSDFFGVVVTHEDFWFSSAADVVDYVDPELESRVIKKLGEVPIPFEKILFITIDRVEELINAVGKQKLDLPTVLSECVASMRTPVGRRFTMSHLLLEKFGSDLYSHPLLINKADEWFEFYENCISANAKVWGGKVKELIEMRSNTLHALHHTLDIAEPFK